MENNIANLCINKFNELKLNKKFNNGEWTVLSGIIYEIDLKQNILILSCGTKCLNSKNVLNGFVITDSHAEIIAKRSFHKYLISYLIKKEKKEKIDIDLFDKIDLKYKLKSNVKLHFYISQCPCGDAAIYEDNLGPPPTKKSKIDYDGIHRTGARIVNSTCKDSIDINNLYEIGKIRLKPGRGNQTLSVSCSDKIAMWNNLGIQGSILSEYFYPIYFNNIIIGDYYNDEAINRAIINRVLPLSSIPIINNTSIIFQYSELNILNKNKTNINIVKPSSLSFNWINNEGIEITIGNIGGKQGCNKNNIKNCQSRLSRYSLLKLLKEYIKEKDILNYKELKDKNKEYNENKEKLLKKLIDWPRKNREEYNFIV